MDIRAIELKAKLMDERAIMWIRDKLDGYKMVGWISDEWDRYRGIGWKYEVNKRDRMKKTMNRMDIRGIEGISDKWNGY